MDEKNKKQTKKSRKKTYGIKNMGINIDKNEYYEIILSNSNHPESVYNKTNTDRY